MIICVLGHLLESRGMTQKAFSEASGIHINTINRLCLNKYKLVSVDTMERLVMTLNVKLSDIFVSVKDPR